MKRIGLTEHMDAELAIFADKEMLDLILRNLLSNAIKYTDMDGTIEVGAKRQGEMVVLSVRDNGKGEAASGWEMTDGGGDKPCGILQGSSGRWRSAFREGGAFLPLSKIKKHVKLITCDEAMNYLLQSVERTITENRTIDDVIVKPAVRGIALVLCWKARSRWGVKPRMRKWTASILFLLTTLLLSGCSMDKIIVLDPKGPIGEAQKDLIYLSTILCLVIIVPVLLLTVWIVWRYRDKPGRKAAYKPNWEHNTKLEITWWSIPIVIILILATVTVKYTHALEPSKPIESDKKPVTIQVTSLEWKWLFQYPEEGIATINYVNIPEDRPVRFLLTAEMAMNSFWVPQLGGQIYAMSGMAMTLYLQADEPGTYYGSGANFTGKHFAKMTFDVNATSQEEYDAWVKQVKGSSPALTEEGYKQLKIPGASERETYSSFPKGLFEQVVNQYAVGGGAHRHHAMPAPASEPEPPAPAPSSDKEQKDQHAGHAGH